MLRPTPKPNTEARFRGTVYGNMWTVFDAPAVAEKANHQFLFVIDVSWPGCRFGTRRIQRLQTQELAGCPELGRTQQRSARLLESRPDVGFHGLHTRQPAKRGADGDACLHSTHERLVEMPCHQ